MKTNKQGKKSSRTKEQVGSVRIKLCNKTFQTMVSDVLKNVYGTGPHGQLRYFVNDTTIIFKRSLRVVLGTDVGTVETHHQKGSYSHSHVTTCSIVETNY